MNECPEWSVLSSLSPSQLTKRLPGLKTIEISGIRYQLIWDTVTEDRIKLVASPPGRNSVGLHLRGAMQASETGTRVQFREPLLRDEILIVALIWTALGAFVAWLMWSTIQLSPAIGLVMLMFYVVVTFPLIAFQLVKWCRTRKRIQSRLGMIFHAEPVNKLE